MKKRLAILMSVLMALTIMAGMTVTVWADGTTEPEVTPITSLVNYTYTDTITTTEKSYEKVYSYSPKDTGVYTFELAKSSSVASANSTALDQTVVTYALAVKDPSNKSVGSADYSADGVKLRLYLKSNETYSITAGVKKSAESTDEVSAQFRLVFADDATTTIKTSVAAAASADAIKCTFEPLDNITKERGQLSVAKYKVKNDSTEGYYKFQFKNTSKLDDADLVVELRNRSELPVQTLDLFASETGSFYVELIAGDEYTLLIYEMNSQSITSDVEVDLTVSQHKDHQFGQVASEEGLIEYCCTECGYQNDDYYAFTIDDVTIDSVTYTGSKIKASALKVNFKLEYAAENTNTTLQAAIPSDAYSVSITKSRTNVGKGEATITFKGNYANLEPIECIFKVVPKKTSLSKLTAGSKSFTAKWNKKTTQTTGYQIYYKLENASSWEKVTISNNKTVSKKISKLKTGKKYVVKVRTYKKVSGTKYYSAWSATKTVKVK